MEGRELAQLYGTVGDYVKALHYAQRAVDTTSDDKLKLLKLQGLAHYQMGLVRLWREEFIDAREHFKHTLDHYQTVRDDVQVYNVTTHFAWLYYLSSEYETALASARSSVEFFRKADNALHRDTFLAEALTILSRILAIVGELGKAQSIAIEALTLAHSKRIIPLQGQALMAVAAWLSSAGYQVRAVQIAALIQVEPRFAASDKRDASRILAILQAQLPTTDYQTAVEQGKSLELETVIQILRAEFGTDEG